MAKPGPRPSPLELRVFTKIERPSATACWRWLGATDRWGRGVFSVWDPELRRTKTFRALHLVAALLGAEIPPGARLRLSCGAPECVNPGHIAST